MDPLIIPIVALLIPMIIVPTAMGIKHARYLREVEHTERMRAMELGQTLAEDESWTPGERRRDDRGRGADRGDVHRLHRRPQAGGRARPSGTAAGMIGMAGVICGSILAGHVQFSKRARPGGLVKDEKPALRPRRL